MTEQYDSLNEQTKMIDISLKYTRGDMDKAKEMASGQYNDVVVIKGKFMIPRTGESGLFFGFINIFDEYIAAISTALADDNGIFTKIRIFDDWKILFEDLNSFELNTEKSNKLEEFLMENFIKFDIFREAQEQNLEDMTVKVNNIFKDYSEGESIQSQIELEETSSLELALKGIDINSPYNLESEQEETTAQKKVESSAEDERIQVVENEAEYIVEGVAIVSPVKGKYINDINVGEKIKVLLSGKDAVSRKLITVLNAMDSEGKLSAVNGRLKAKIPLDKSGYVLYALVAKGILVKIIEEENVKIQIVQGDQAEVAQKEANDNSLVYIMSIIVGLILLAGLALILLL